jgi:hypothetical protein
VISDYEDQPLLISSHHGVYALVTVGRGTTSRTWFARRSAGAART